MYSTQRRPTTSAMRIARAGDGASRGTQRGSAPPTETPEMRRTVSLAVERAKVGDVDALRFLYVRYADNVRGYVRSILHDEFEAEDVTQAVFAKLMTSITRYDERAVPFFGWLLRVSHNAAIDQLRANRCSPVAEVHGADASSDADRSDRRDGLTAALGMLPDEQRSVVLLRHLVGLTPGEIADLLGRTESSVHGLHHRGRRALRDELSRMESAPSTAGAAA